VKINYCKVEIALAIYNGSAYLGEFLQSLNLQSNLNWTVLARDDGSSDDSVSIFKDWISRCERMRLLETNLSNLGTVKNFSEILSNTTAEYVMLADQDDIWHPEKIAKSLAQIRELERSETGEVVPALVYSDLHVVDDKLNLINSSFIKMQGLDEMHHPSFIQLLTQNVAPGCTMMVNRALLDLALPIPNEAAMHDWWLMQVASLFGRIGYIDEPLIAYRQHGSNQVGAITRSFFSMFCDLIGGARLYKNRIFKAQLQAKVLIERYGDLINRPDFAAAVTFSGLSKFCVGYRQYLAWRHGLRKSGFFRNLGFYYLM
jgi:glycosyltransferase involved in cell wall biosynthesis